MSDGGNRFPAWEHEAFRAVLQMLSHCGRASPVGFSSEEDIGDGCLRPQERVELPSVGGRGSELLHLGDQVTAVSMCSQIWGRVLNVFTVNKHLRRQVCWLRFKPYIPYPCVEMWP